MICEGTPDIYSNHESGLSRLVDANNAGTEHAGACTLILTEGDSGAAFANAGLGVVGKDYFGVYPLCGKLLNVCDATLNEVQNNQDLLNLHKIMGLQYNKEYTNIYGLRYGRLMIMTNQDLNGFHFKGLLISFLDHFYPSLLRLPEFVIDFVTPIIRATHGQKQRDFFTIPEYEKWLEETPGGEEWVLEHFTGLQAFSDADARYFFTHMGRYMIPFSTCKEGDKELIDLVFSADKKGDRRKWLCRYKPGTQLDRQMGEEVSLSEFINKELILFFIADNVRSMPLSQT